MNEIIQLIGLESIILCISLALFIMRNICMCGELHFNSESYFNYILLGIIIGMFYILIFNPTGLLLYDIYKRD